MTDSLADRARRLLDDVNVLALGVIVEGAPYVGLLPFALTADRRAAIVHASRLARHTAGLGEGAPFSALIQRPAPPGADPLQAERLTLLGYVAAPSRDTGHDSPRERYLARFPTSEVTFTLGDFALYLLHIERARFVGGFARALDLTGEQLANA
jgi:putative heme iron utilization protein